MTNTRCPILVALLLSLAAPGCSAGTIPGRELDAPRTQTDLREALRGGWVVTASRAERGDWERAERESLLELGPSGRLSWTRPGAEERDARWQLVGRDVSLLTSGEGPWTLRIDSVRGAELVVFDHEAGRYLKLERREVDATQRLRVAATAF